MTIKDNGDGTFGVISPTWLQKDVWIACRNCGQKVIGDSIHTCSPQLKPLSDEEIHKLAQDNFHAGLGISPLDFARAIEERHGIK